MNLQERTKSELLEWLMLLNNILIQKQVGVLCSLDSPSELDRIKNDIKLAREEIDRRESLN